jgi:hypothetical protein
MGASLKTSGGAWYRSSTPQRHQGRLRPYPDSQPTGAWPQIEKTSGTDAAGAVALAFARVMAERYPGTNWLPTKRGRSGDRLVVPAGKVIRLLTSPADMDPGGRIGHPTAPTAYGRTPHEHGADTRAQ